MAPPVNRLHDRRRQFLLCGHTGLNVETVKPIAADGIALGRKPQKQAIKLKRRRMPERKRPSGGILKHLVAQAAGRLLLTAALQAANLDRNKAFAIFCTSAAVSPEVAFTSDSARLLIKLLLGPRWSGLFRRQYSAGGRS